MKPLREISFQLDCGMSSAHRRFHQKVEGSLPIEIHFSVDQPALLFSKTFSFNLNPS